MLFPLCALQRAITLGNIKCVTHLAVALWRSLACPPAWAVLPHVPMSRAPSSSISGQHGQRLSQHPPSWLSVLPCYIPLCLECPRGCVSFQSACFQVGDGGLLDLFGSGRSILEQFRALGNVEQRSECGRLCNFKPEEKKAKHVEICPPPPPASCVPPPPHPYPDAHTGMHTVFHDERCFQSRSF